MRKGEGTDRIEQSSRASRPNPKSSEAYSFSDEKGAKTVEIGSLSSSIDSESSVSSRVTPPGIEINDEKGSKISVSEYAEQ